MKCRWSLKVISGVVLCLKSTKIKSITAYIIEKDSNFCISKMPIKV